MASADATHFLLALVMTLRERIAQKRLKNMAAAACVYSSHATSRLQLAVRTKQLYRALHATADALPSGEARKWTRVGATSRKCIYNFSKIIVHFCDVYYPSLFIDVVN